MKRKLFSSGVKLRGQFRVRWWTIIIASQTLQFRWALSGALHACKIELSAAVRPAKKRNRSSSRLVFPCLHFLHALSSSSHTLLVEPRRCTLASHGRLPPSYLLPEAVQILRPFAGRGLPGETVSIARPRRVHLVGSVASPRQGLCGSPSGAVHDGGHAAVLQGDEAAELPSAAPLVGLSSVSSCVVCT